MVVLLPDHGEYRPDEQEDEPPRDHLEQDGTDQPTVGHGHHRSLRGLPSDLVASRRTDRADRPGAAGRPAWPGSGAGRRTARCPAVVTLTSARPKMRAEKGLEDVDALDPVQPDPLGPLLQQAGVDAELPAEQVVPGARPP